MRDFFNLHFYHAFIFSNMQQKLAYVLFSMAVELLRQFCYFIYQRDFFFFNIKFLFVFAFSI